jgi:uncharacterized protein YbjT (DUF2867 family)
MILVSGATGTVGTELVRRLWAEGAQTRALVHDASKADVVRRPEVQIAQGDFGLPETLDAALDGVDVVFLASPPHPQQVQMEGNMIEACKRAGVKHIVKLSIMKASPRAAVPFLKWNGEIERELEQSGITCTCLQPNYFMQNLLRLADNISSTGTIQLPMKDAKVSMIDTRDVAEVALRVLVDPEPHAGKRLVLTGPEALSFEQVADKLTLAMGRKIRYMDTRPDDAHKIIEAAGFEEWYADAALKEAEWIAQGHAAEVTEVVVDITGGMPHDFDSFAEDYADVFTQISPRAQKEERHAA